MKQILPLLLLLSYSIFSRAQTVYPSGVPNCIARWDFANPGTVTTLPDVSGNNNNGAVTNLISSNGFRNVPNHAMKFDGSTSFAEVNDIAMLRPASQISMVALVKADGYYSGLCQVSAILSKGWPNFIPGNYFFGFTDNIYDMANCNVYNPTKNQLISSQGPITHVRTAGNYVNINQWYFVASVYDGINVNYYQVEMDPANYVSAVSPFATIAASGSIGTNFQNLTIGKHLDPSYPYWFNGVMDEVAIFNTAVSNAEIQTIYDYLWGIVRIAEPFNDTTLCSASSFMLPYTVNNSSFFQASNTFTAQLSDASGSFVSPTNIGSVISTTSGSIPCTIHSIPAGSKYRIRIIADHVPYTTYDNGHDIAINSSFTATATIVATPATLSQPNQLVTFTAHPVNCGSNPAYQWRLNNVDVPGANASVWAGNVNHNDVVSLNVIPNIECTQTTGETTVVSYNIYMYNTSVQTIKNLESITITPNPSDGNICLKGNFDIGEKIHFYVYNSAGQQVYVTEMSLLKGEFQKNIKLPEVVNGMYYVRISSETTCKNLKILIQK